MPRFSIFAKMYRGRGCPQISDEFLVGCPRIKEEVATVSRPNARRMISRSTTLPQSCFVSSRFVLFKRVGKRSKRCVVLLYDRSSVAGRPLRGTAWRSTVIVSLSATHVHQAQRSRGRSFPTLHNCIGAIPRPGCSRNTGSAEQRSPRDVPLAGRRVPRFQPLKGEHALQGPQDRTCGWARMVLQAVLFII